MTTKIKFARALGRCRACKAGVSAPVIKVMTERGEHRPGVPIIKTEFVWATRRAARPVRFSSASVECACGAAVSVSVVKGRVNADAACNAKCEASTGPTCECACGGENHGSAH